MLLFSHNQWKQKFKKKVRNALLHMEQITLFDLGNTVASEHHKRTEMTSYKHLKFFVLSVFLNTITYLNEFPSESSCITTLLSLKHPIFSI